MVFKIFPTESNKPIISWRHYLLKSLLAHLKVARQLNINIWSHGTIIVRNHVQSLSVGKYYTSLLKSHACNNYCYINKEISIHHYDANELNVFDISRICHGRSSFSFVFVIVYTMTSQVISDRGCELSKYGVPNIFPEFLIRLTFKLNISKNTKPKWMRPTPLNS